MELHFTIDIITVAERFHRMRRKDLILLKVVLGSSMVIDYIDHRHILSQDYILFKIDFIEACLRTITTIGHHILAWQFQIIVIMACHHLDRNQRKPSKIKCHLPFNYRPIAVEVAFSS